MEFLTRVALYMHTNNVKSELQARQRGNMRPTKTQSQNRRVVNWLSTAIGFLLRVMDNSNGQ